MFKINSKQIVRREITVYQPGEGDKFVAAKLQADLRLIPDSELQDLNDLPPSQLVDRVLVKVYGVGDADGTLMSDEDALAAVKDDSLCVAAIAAHYVEMKGRNFRSGRAR